MLLLPHFTVFYFVSYLDILKWKAFLIKPAVCSVSMIDVTIENTTLIMLKFAQFLQAILTCVKRRCWRCLLVTLLEFLLNLNSLPSYFSRPFFSPGCSRGKELSAHFVHFVVERFLTIFGRSRYMS